MLVQNFLEQTAEILPDKVALVCQNQSLSYSKLESYANTLANALLELGLRDGDRVAIYLENSPESVLSIFATLKAGGIFLVINPLLKARKLEYILRNCRARFLISESRLAGRCGGTYPDLEHVVFTDALPTEGAKEYSQRLFRELLNLERAERPRSRRGEHDLCSLIYTSGSTGWPKGVMLSHRNMTMAATTIIDYLENLPDDVILNLLPLAFDYGLYNVLMPIRFGGTVILEKTFTYPYQLTGLVQKEKVSGLPLVPMIIAILLRFPQVERYDLSTVRYITNTGQALATEYIDKLERVFPAAKIYSMYGLTECKRVSYLPPAQLHVRPESVGKAMPNTRAYLVDETGELIDSADTTGELIVEGEHVMQGYWEQTEQTRKVLGVGNSTQARTLRTGDLFRMDREGYLYFVARKDDLIKTAGERVSPGEIEALLHEMEGVADVAAYGVPHEFLGQVVAIAIVPKLGTDLSKEAVLAYCEQQMEKYMIPKTVELLDALPVTPSGKTDYQALKINARERSEGCAP